MMKHLIVLFSFFQFGAIAQTVPSSLDSLLDHTLDSMRLQMGVKSLSAAMQLPDGSVWAGSSGFSSLTPAVQATPEHLYLIGSVTKTITSACILQMVDEGLITLDDSLHQWLDTLPFINPNITVRQLLRHTSGIYDVLSHPNNQDSLLADLSRIWTPLELIDNFIGPPLFAPGAMWSYSNTNYMLLGMIVEQVSGNPFYTEIRERFYAPLGLGSFSIPAFEPIGSPIAHSWLDVTGDQVTDDIHDFYMNYLSLNSTAGAAGGYFSTASDCAKWTRSYLRGDLHSDDALAEAKTMVTAPGTPGGKYGLGLMERFFLGNKAYGHGGDLVYAASSWYFPLRDVSITVFTNEATFNSWTLLPVVTELLRDCIQFESLTDLPPSPVPAAASLSAAPNPIEDKLEIALQLPRQVSEATFTLCDALGRSLKVVQELNLPAGEHRVSLGELGLMPPGVYFLTADLDGQQLEAIRLLKN